MRQTCQQKPGVCRQAPAYGVKDDDEKGRELAEAHAADAKGCCGRKHNEDLHCGGEKACRSQSKSVSPRKQHTCIASAIDLNC